MYIYDSQQQGFVRTDTTARFPAEEALSLRGPGEPGVGVGEGNCEELFASAERALRRAEREEAVRRKKSKSKSKKEKEKEKRFPSIATQVAQFQPNNSSPLAGPAIMFPPPPPPPPPPQTPPEVLERQVSDQSACTNGGQGQSSWLNIDLPLQRPGTPLPAPAPYSFTESAPYTHPLPPVPTIPAAAAHHPRSRSRAPSVTSSITSHISQWTARFSPRRILAGSTNTRSRTPQHTDLYAPAITLQQLVNECVLVLCLYGHRRSRDPRIARLPLPNAVSDDDFDDRELLTQMRVRYNRLRGFWRRVLSLRGLRRIAVVEVCLACRCVVSWCRNYGV